MGTYPRILFFFTPVFLTGEFHGQRSLASCSPWGCKESDTTEQLTLSLFSLNNFRLSAAQVLLAVFCELQYPTPREIWPESVSGYQDGFHFQNEHNHWLQKFSRVRLFKRMFEDFQVEFFNCFLSLLWLWQGSCIALIYKYFFLILLF